MWNALFQHSLWDSVEGHNLTSFSSLGLSASWNWNVRRVRATVTDFRLQADSVWFKANFRFRAHAKTLVERRREIGEKEREVRTRRVRMELTRGIHKLARTKLAESVFHGFLFNLYPPLLLEFLSVFLCVLGVVIFALPSQCGCGWVWVCVYVCWCLVSPSECIFIVWCLCCDAAVCKRAHRRRAPRECIDETF